jgi:predicted hydrocarbon binding protein
MPGRAVLISQDELKDIRELYEGVMSHASHGLFFKEGSIIGIGIASLANRDKKTYFDTCRRVLVEKNWVRDVTFTDDTIIVQGSIEASSKSGQPTCHRLRGIFRKLYEVYLDKKVYCQEIDCESAGKGRCTFKIETESKW